MDSFNTENILELTRHFMSSLEVILTVIGFIPLYADLFMRLRERYTPSFVLQRFRQESEKPIESSWSIRILHPNKPIERCSVTYNGVRLPWWNKPDKPEYEEFIHKMGGGNVLIPKGIEKDDAKVVVKDGKKTIRKRRFEDIPLVDA